MHWIIMSRYKRTHGNWIWLPDMRAYIHLNHLRMTLRIFLLYMATSNCVSFFFIISPCAYIFTWLACLCVCGRICCRRRHHHPLRLYLPHKERLPALLYAARPERFRYTLFFFSIRMMDLHHRVISENGAECIDMHRDVDRRPVIQQTRRMGSVGKRGINKRINDASRACSVQLLSSSD